jgi:hypothetical protein
MSRYATANAVSNYISEIRGLMQSQVSTEGGGINYNNYTVDNLRKYAIKKKIKITKKKNGLTVYVKKSTLIKKIIEFVRSK